MNINLYPDFHVDGERGVWGVLLEAPDCGRRRKWYGTLGRTTAAHLLHHAVQEGLSAIRGQGHTVTVHARPPGNAVSSAHQVQYTGTPHTRLGLEDLLPQAVSLPSGTCIPTTISGLSSPEMQLCLSAARHRFWLAQISGGNVRPMVQLPSFSEGHSPLRLTPEGFILTRAHYRELLLMVAGTPTPAARVLN